MTLIVVVLVVIVILSTTTTATAIHLRTRSRASSGGLELGLGRGYGPANFPPSGRGNSYARLHSGSGAANNNGILKLEGAVGGLFPVDPLFHVRGLPAVHEPTIAQSANARTPVLLRRLHQNERSTSTKQGCNIEKVAVSIRSDTVDDLTRMFQEDDFVIQALTDDLELKVLNHLTWFTGVDDVQYCTTLPSHVEQLDLPDWHTGCLFEDATVATLKRADNLPMQPLPGHFFSDIDFRHEYAVLGTPGGDLGEFARGIGAVEQLLGVEIPDDVITALFTQFVDQMHRFGKDYFCMSSDADADEAWYAAANVKPPLMPIDEHGRIRLIRAAGFLSSIGSPSLRVMVKDLDGSRFGTRAAVTQAAIEAFAATQLNPFNPHRSKLLYVPSPPSLP